MKALSIVRPNATRIAQGLKTLEIRSWLPELSPDEDLLLVENGRYLSEDGECDPDGKPIALVKVQSARSYVPEDVMPACAKYWVEGYYSWELSDVRPIRVLREVPARRGIYSVEVTADELELLPRTEPVADGVFLGERLLELLSSNELLSTILDRSETLGVSDWAVGAGIIQQTVFNVLHGRPALENVKDIDWVYFDGSDLSEDAESHVIRKVKDAFPRLPLPLDIKNQARVHLWYERKFGYQIPAARDLTDAISTWPTTSTAVALTRRNSKTEIYSPFGLRDLLSMIIRANKRQITEVIYRSKVSRWSSVWNKLKVIPWEDS